MVSPIDSLFPLGEEGSSASRHFYPLSKGRKQTDSKVARAVLQSIQQGGRDRIDLLFSPFDLQSFWEFGSVEGWQEEARNAIFKPFRRQRKSLRLKRVTTQSIPIGICRVRTRKWGALLASLMQFLLFFPEMVDLFFFLPRSFQPFMDFVDQYVLDQQRQRAVSFADCSTLVACLIKKNPSFEALLEGNQFYSVLRALLKTLFSSEDLQRGSFLLQSDKDLSWRKGSLKELLNHPSVWALPELLVHVPIDVERHPLSAQWQIFLPGHKQCYELKSFVEKRSDEEEVSYIPYLKIRGKWYQCDEERIVPFRSRSLAQPLVGSILFYYQKIDLSLVDPSRY